MRFSDTTAGRLPRGTAVLLTAALGWAALSASAQAQASADTGALGRAVSSEANLAGAATLSGQVQDEAGKPVARAVVTLGGDSALTSADGQFVLRASPGAYMLSVRRLGFRLERFAVSLAAGESREVTVVATRFVPVLPTVTTTAQERAAYQSIGLDQRMKMGQGQFLTYDQIARKQASYFTDLLGQMRGLRLKPGIDKDDDLLLGTRGLGSCVTFVIDGAPQHQLMVLPPSLAGGPGVVPGPESPNHWITPNDVGAVEVYGPSERPAGFGTDQPCNLVMIWTRARLGLPTDAKTKPTQGNQSSDVSQGVAAFPSEADCSPPTAIDTTNLVVYATVEGARPERISELAWASYKVAVLDALDRSATLPTDLLLPAFGMPFSASGDAKGEGAPDLRAAPTLSNVIQFTLDTSGALRSAHVAASSLSASADTTTLAIVEQAAATHAFPRLPDVSGDLDSAQLFLIVASIEPVIGARAAVIGQLEVPTWHLTRAARLAGTSQSRSNVDSHGQSLEHDVTIEAVISDAGRVIPSTLRVVGSLAGASPASVLDRTLGLQFEPALIGSCPVPELILQPLTTH